MNKLSVYLLSHFCDLSQHALNSSGDLWGLDPERPEGLLAVEEIIVISNVSLGPKL